MSPSVSRVSAFLLACAACEAGPPAQPAGQVVSLEFSATSSIASNPPPPVHVVVSDPERAQGEDPRASELLGRGAARARTELAGEPLLQAELLHTIGRIQRELGQFEPARRTLEEALALRERRLGADAGATAQTRFELGHAVWELGERGAGREQMAAAVAAAGRTLPPADADRLRLEIDFADLLVYEGDAPAARRLVEDVLARLAGGGEAAGAPRRKAESLLAAALAASGESSAAAERLERLVAEERRERPGSRALGAQSPREDARQRAR